MCSAETFPVNALTQFECVALNNGDKKIPWYYKNLLETESATSAVVPRNGRACENRKNVTLHYSGFLQHTKLHNLFTRQTVTTHMAKPELIKHQMHQSPASHQDLKDLGFFTSYTIK